MGEIETVISEASPARADGTPFPTKAPEGWVHLSVAVAKITAALLPDGTWKDAYVPCLGLASTDPAPDTEDGRTSEEIANFIADWFLEACQFEYLKTGYRPVGGGARVEPIPSVWWDVEDKFLRFRSWSIDPDNLLSDRLDLPHWIWVEEQSLSRCLDKIWRKRDRIGKRLFVEAGRLIGVADALDTLAPFAPQLGGEAPTPGAPAGARELISACAAGAVHAIATRMERSVAPNGGPGKLVEAESNWMIPADLWRSVDLSPNQNWAAGTFFATPDERNSLRLERVQIDRLDLMLYLESMGLLVRVQFRHKGEDEPFAERFAPAISSMIGEPGEEPLDDEGGEDELLPTDRTGAPGRPSAMHLVASMMRERFRNGEWLPTLSQESEELERLFAADPKYEALAKPKAKTIKNVLGSTYRQLKLAAEQAPTDPEKK